MPGPGQPCGRQVTRPGSRPARMPGAKACSGVVRLVARFHRQGPPALEIQAAGERVGDAQAVLVGIHHHRECLGVDLEHALHDGERLRPVLADQVVGAEQRGDQGAQGIRLGVDPVLRRQQDGVVVLQPLVERQGLLVPVDEELRAADVERAAQLDQAVQVRLPSHQARHVATGGGHDALRLVHVDQRHLGGVEFEAFRQPGQDQDLGVALRVGELAALQLCRVLQRHPGRQDDAGRLRDVRQPADRPDGDGLA